MAHSNDRLDDAVLRLDVDILDERAVDLDDVERQLAEVRQARIAGTEVVECKLDPGILERRDHRSRILDIGKQRAFGEFDDQSARRQPVLGERPQNLFG